MRLVLQSESAECGLAALAMVADHHGLGLSLLEMRQRFAYSLKGAKLDQLMAHAAALNLATRPLRLELDEMSALRVPAILHWDLDHFVVLKRVRRGQVWILDPAMGERRLSLDEASRHFTGVALELAPTADFRPQRERPRLGLNQLTGVVHGLKRALGLIFAVALVLQLLAIIAPLLTQIVVDEVLTSGDAHMLTVLVIGFGLLLLAQTALSAARSWMVLVLSQSLSQQWSSNVFGHLLRLPVAYFERRFVGDIASRFGSVGAIQRTLTTGAIEAVLDGVTAVAALLMMWIYSQQLALVVLVAVALYALLRWLSFSTLRDATGERMMLGAREQTHFLETLRAILPLKLFGQEDERRSRWLNLMVEGQNRDADLAKVGIGISSANALIFGLENLLVLWLGAQLILEGSTAAGTAGFTVGMLMAFISYKGQFGARVTALIDFGIQLRLLALHCDRLADIVLEPVDHDGAGPQELAQLPASLELCNVSFRYAAGEPWILRNVNLSIQPGESLALVGASGSGKTTLLKILLGVLQPQEGELRFGGLPVRRLGISNVRRQIGSVMQEDLLLSGSLLDNIGFFDRQVDGARVEACAKLAQLHDDVQAMPMGYRSLVGDLGHGLSGGQKQRVLLARALYRQPRILVLDEATCHLDSLNERAITEALAQLNMTRLVIAHRRETIACAQRVMQVRQGQVVELKRRVDATRASDAEAKP